MQEMKEEMQKQAPEEGPHGVDRWTSNGYGLTIDGIEVTTDAKEAKYGNNAEEHAPDER